ncbi:MAG: GWxTD domain-containing protein [Candidatus Latescibacteria bacterium]|nr:GWxTD domain-containing protein [Candidatus Latescibacterota bacterium]
MKQPNHPFMGWCAVVTFFLCGTGQSLAQKPPDLPEFSTGNQLSPPFLTIDITTAQGPAPENEHVEVHYRLVNDGLRFIKKGQDYRARFELSLVINDTKNYQLTGTTVRDSVTARSEEETNSLTAFKDSLFVAEIPPGKYVVVANLLDLESSEEINLSQKFTVPDYHKKELSLSDLEFARHIEPAATASPYVRHGFQVLPSLTRAYGENRADLYVYYEVYTTADLSAAKPLKVAYKIKAANGQVAHTQQRVLERKGPAGGYSDRFDVAGLGQGTYMMEVEVTDEAIRKSARTSGEFHVLWQYLLPLTSPKNYKEIVEQLRYIASTSELKELEKAAPADQHAALERFWRRHDPSPGTDKNENLITYYSRIEYANKHFTNAMGRGWKSDQGRIYVLLGPPDEVERFAFERDSNPYQVWHYYTISRHFMFVDRDGFGQYYLYRIY